MINLEEPDKGRAWLVAFSACIINTILSGISRMIGILYVAVIDTYGVTRAEATLPFTIRNSIRSLAGPIVGIVGQLFGIRAVTFCGGVVAAAGAALCCIAPDVLWLDILWGGVHGLGFAFACTLIQVVVNQYFHKYKVTASGIALSGACVGSFVFPIIVEWILDTYGLSGGFLILGGIVMNVLPPALLLSAPQWITYPEAYARLSALKNKNTSSVETVDTVAEEEEEEGSIPEDDDEEEDKEEIIDRKLVRTTSLSDCPMDGMCSCSSLKDNLWRGKKMVFHHGEGDRKCRTRKISCTLYKVQESPVFERKDGLIEENEHYTKRTNSEVFTISDKVETKTTIPSVDKSNLNKISNSNKNNNQSLTETLKSIVKLYNNPIYVLLNVCMSTYVIIFIPILTVIVDYGVDKGISESDGKYLINALAFGDLIGRLGFGWVTDKKLMTIPTFMCMMLVLQGASIALFPFSSSLSSLMTLLALYGMTAGSILVLFPVLVFKYVKVEVQSVAVSCVGFMSGLLSLAIAPMIGHFRDDVGSYDGMFFLTGIISVVSGGMWLLEPVVVNFYYGKKAAKAAKSEAEVNIIQNNMKNIKNISIHNEKNGS